MEDPLTFGFFARYHANLDHGLQENELVYVYFGRLHARPKPNPDEVAKLEFVSVSELSRRIKQKPEAYAFWLRHYFQKHRAEIARCAEVQRKRAG